MVRRMNVEMHQAMVNTSTKAATTDLVLGRMENHDHEEVLFCYDRPTGLKAIIAIHDTEA